MPDIKITLEGDQHYIDQIAESIGLVLDSEDFLDENDISVEQLTHKTLNPKTDLIILEVGIQEVAENE